MKTALTRTTTLTLALAAFVFAGSAFADTQTLKAQRVTPPPVINNLKANPTQPTTPGNFTATMPAMMKCMSGYTKTDEHINANGGVDRMECTSPVFECPHKSKVKNKNGAAANGQGIEVEKIPVGNPGDTNRFKIRYTCTYFWTQG